MYEDFQLQKKRNRELVLQKNGIVQKALASNHQSIHNFNPSETTIFIQRLKY